MHSKLLLFSLISALLPFSQVARAETVFIDPATATVSPSQVFTVEVKGSGFGGVLDGGGFDVSFNPRVLNVESIKVDTSVWEFAPIDGAIDNLNGKITDTEFNSFVHNNTGSFDIAQISFLSVGAGASNISLVENQNNPFASGGNPVTVTFTEANIISGIFVPLPAPVWLFGAALAGLGAGQRRKQAR